MHYYGYKKTLKDVHINNHFIKLYKKILSIWCIHFEKKSSRIHPFALAKLKTVAVRFPKHKVIKLYLMRLIFKLYLGIINLKT